MADNAFAFLDIETSWNKTITVIGIYRSGESPPAGRQGTLQLVAPEITRERLVEALSGVEVIFTYNGARFDLPVIEQALGIDLESRHAHRDLMIDCWKHQLKGGLKAVELRLGIHRDTEGVDGLQAMSLWAAHQKGHPEALELLLRYNREDCENLEILARRLNVIPGSCLPAGRLDGLPAMRSSPAAVSGGSIKTVRYNYGSAGRLADDDKK